MIDYTAARRAAETSGRNGSSAGDLRRLADRFEENGETDAAKAFRDTADTATSKKEETCR